MKTIKVKELEVPTGAMPEVVDILIDNDLDNSLTGTNEDHDFICLKVSYDNGDDYQKAVIHDIENIIAEYEAMIRKVSITKIGINPVFVFYLNENQYYIPYPY